MARNPYHQSQIVQALIQIARATIGDRTLKHANGERALTPLADLLAGRTVTKSGAHSAGLDLCDLVEILRRDFAVPIIVTTEADEDGTWPEYITMRPNEIAHFISPRERAAQISRWEQIIKANDMAHAARCAIEFYAEMGCPIDPKAASVLTEPRHVPDINAGNSYALLNAPALVTPVPMPNERIDAEYAASQKGAK